MFVRALLGLAAALLAVQSIGKLRRSSSPAHLPLPPGPSLIQFLFSLSRSPLYLAYAAWSKTYGNIIYTRVLGKDVIMLNSEEVAIELLEKRSKKYSDRPVFPTAGLLGWEWTTALVRYGPTFRLHRRLLHQVFRADASLTYRQSQLRKAYELLTHLLCDSARYEAHFTTFSAAVAVAVTYGCSMKEGDAFVASMQRAADIFTRSTTPQLAALGMVFPFLKPLPAWLPGMGFKHEIAKCRRLVSEAVNTPYMWVKQRVEQGNAAPSMVADAFTRYHSHNDCEREELMRAIKHTAGSLYSASVATTNAILLTFIYLMMTHPAAQRRAQEEVDRVVGRQRLPDFEDRPSLPYVDAILRETIRWHPIAPIILHATSEDDTYQGYHIPKGAIIMINIWSISRNEGKYSDPEMFTPERFLRNDGTLNDDKVTWAFGFGRRICPGRYFADASLWSAMACILALFMIEKTEGSENVKWMTGLTRRPLPFPCKFVPRDEEMDPQKLASLIYASRIDL